MPENLPAEGKESTFNSTTNHFGTIESDSNGIVGPLPRSRLGKRYVLVICDYATRYLEAIPLRSIDAERRVGKSACVCVSALRNSYRLG